jgi:CO/xanthine dehydrogenase FAD-binding subunit
VLLESFNYIKPPGLLDAFEVLYRLKDERVRVLAGGTDLVPRLRSQVEHVSHLVDLADCGLDGIAVRPECIEIGALTTFATICRSPDIRDKLPALYESSSQIGARQCRTLATIGGNVCSAVPSLDSAPSLLALDAKFRLQSKRGERLVHAEQFFVAPRRTILAPGEILTHITVPIREDFTASFLRIGRRKALTLAIVNAAAGVALSDTGEVSEVRIALGAVAPTPICAHRAEEFLLGRNIDAELISKAAEIAITETSPISDIRASAEYRKKLVAVLVRRALGKAILRQPMGVGR